MSNKLKWIGIVVVVLILLLAIAPFLIPVNRFKPEIESRASAALGRKVQVGNLSLSLLSGSLGIDDLSVADDPKFSTAPFLTAKGVKVGVEMMPLIFSKTVNVTGITIDKPQVIMLKDPRGKWNFSSIGGSASSTPAPSSAPSAPSSSSSSSTDISIAKLELKDGQITLGNTNSQKRSVYPNVNLTATDVSVKSNFPIDFSMGLPGGGTMKIDGKVGPVDQKDAQLTPQNVKLTVNGLSLATTGFLDPSMGLGGVADMDANLVSANGEMSTKGQLKLSKALLIAGGSPATVPLNVDFDTKYDLVKSAGVLNPSTIKIGNATAKVNGTYRSEGDNFVVDLKVAGDGMPAKDLEGFLPAIAVNLPQGANLTTGTLATNLHITGPTNRLVTDGNVGLFKATLAGFDLGSKMTAISALTGLQSSKDLQIEKMTTNVHMAPTGLKADNFDAVLPALGTLVGQGTLDSKNNMDFAMVATLQHGIVGGLSAGSQIGALTGAKACKDSGGTKIPFKIEGTTANPKFVPDTGGVAADLLKSQLGCAGGAANGLQGMQGITKGNPADTINQLGGMFGKKKKP
jgi:AsmA protein